MIYDWDANIPGQPPPDWDYSDEENEGSILVFDCLDEKENLDDNGQNQPLTATLCQPLLGKDTIKSLQNKWNSTICESELLTFDDLMSTNEQDELKSITKFIRKRSCHSETRDFNINNDNESIK